MNTDVRGLRVIVTAGASGIGRAIAEEFLLGGADVHVCDVDAEARRVFGAANPTAGVWDADVSDEGQVDGFIAAAIDSMGGVDALVNNAGIAGPAGRCELLDVEGWRRTFDVNITGMFLTSRRVIPHLVAQRSGSIVNIASTAGLLGFPYRAPYAASKWAVIGFTKTLAMELGEFNVRANAICPGSVDAARMDRVIELEAAASGRPAEQIRAGFMNAASMRTFIDATDIAAMARFVCSPAGSKISGQALSVDGHTETART